MEKEIKFNGYASQQSDYASTDGDLSLSLNLINEDGSLHGVQQPTDADVPVSLSSRWSHRKLLCVHKTSSQTNYIYSDMPIPEPTPTTPQNSLSALPAVGPAIVAHQNYLWIFNGTADHTDKITVELIYPLTDFTTGGSTAISDDNHPSFTLSLELTDGTICEIAIDPTQDEQEPNPETWLEKDGSTWIKRVFRYDDETIGLSTWNPYTNPVAHMSAVSDDEAHDQEYFTPDSNITSILNVYVKTQESEHPADPSEEISLSLNYGYYEGELTPHEKIDDLTYYTDGSSELTARAIGNILVVHIPDGTLRHYFFKDGTYRILPPLEMPEYYPYLETDLMGLTRVVNTFGEGFIGAVGGSILGGDKIVDTDWKRLYDGDVYSLTFDKSVRGGLYDMLFSAINQCTNSISHNGLFWAPFFVRFALRMYDGKHILHSEPILMTPTSLAKPLFGVYSTKSGDDYYADFDPIFPVSRLGSKINLHNEEWKDIITHLDIYVSAPLVDYSDSAEAIKGAHKLLTYKSTLDQAYASASEEEKGRYVPDYWYEKSCGEIGYMVDDYSTSTDVNHINSTKTYLGGKWYDTPRVANAAEGYLILPTSTFTDIRIDSFTGSLKGRFKSMADDYDKVVYKNGSTSVTWATIFPDSYSGYMYVNMKDLLNKRGKSIGFVVSETTVFTYLKIKGKSDTTTTKPNFVLDIERVDERSIEDIVQDTASFHLVHSIPVDELEGEVDITIPIKKNILENISTRETLDDKGLLRDTHTKYDYVTDYNKRLHAVISKKAMPESDALSVSCPAYKLDYDDGVTDLEIIYGAFVEVHENNQYAYKTIPVTSTLTGFLCTTNALVYYAYPNPNATRLVLATGENKSSGAKYRLYEVKLKRHAMMSTAYAFNNWDALDIQQIGEDFNSTQEMFAADAWANYIDGTNTIDYGNLLYITNVNNPFRFDDALAASFQADVLALATITQPLSQGQAGKFPLYAFTRDGIWALEVSNEGTYLDTQALSRDVLLGKDNFVQTDGSIIFATERGLMELSGTKPACISEGIDTEFPFNINDLDLNTPPTLATTISTLSGVPATSIKPFREFLDGCRMIYDYPNQRLVIYNPKYEAVDGVPFRVCEYAYVYSLRSRLWGMMECDIKYSVNNYPETLVVTDLNDIEEFAPESSTDNAVKGIILTRPIHLDAPDLLKTIDYIAARGYFEQGHNDNGTAVASHVKSVLWGSRDLMRWYPIASSTNHIIRGFSGTPYKYFRLALLVNLDAKENVYGATVRFKPRYINNIH